MKIFQDFDTPRAVDPVTRLGYTVSQLLVPLTLSCVKRVTTEAIFLLKRMLSTCSHLHHPSQLGSMPGQLGPEDVAKSASTQWGAANTSTIVPTRMIQAR